MCLRTGFLEVEPDMQILMQVIYLVRESLWRNLSKEGSRMLRVMVPGLECQHHLLEIHILRSHSGAPAQNSRVGQ